MKRLEDVLQDEGFELHERDVEGNETWDLLEGDELFRTLYKRVRISADYPAEDSLGFTPPLYLDTQKGE